MNRHERRAAEARARAASGRDSDFEVYQAIYRHAFSTAPERDIGESYMRGQVAQVNGLDVVVIYPPDSSPSPAAETDIYFSARYRLQRFMARMPCGYFRTLADEWPKFVAMFAKHMRGNAHNLVTGDLGHDARAFIFEMIVDNQWQGNALNAGLTAAALAWLTSTSPAGVAIGVSHRLAHYEITDQEELAANGRRARNFHLVLSHDLETLLLPPVPKR